MVRRNNQLEHLTTLTGRSYNQIEQLYSLVGQDYQKLVKLEWHLYNDSSFHSTVPTTQDQVNTILSSNPKSVRVELVFWNKMAKI